MKFETATLDNGLEIVAECNAEAYSTALGFFVNTGARDESDDVSGVSHFLEHMVFKGTSSRSAEDVNREFDEMGAHYNAFTNEENTVYYAAVLPEYQVQTVQLLADIMRPSLRDDDFHTEKKVILEEIKMYDDQPPFGVDDKCRAAFFGHHPLSHSVLGTAQSVGGLQVDQMRQYFERRYSPGNMTLVGSGRIDFAELCRTAEKICGNWKSIEAARQLPPAAPNAGFHVVHKDSATQEYAILMSPGPAATDADRYAAKVLATVLGDDSGSRLYWELVDPGVAEHCSLHHHEYLGAGMFLTYMSCDPEYAAENLEGVFSVYREANEGGITQAELDQAKSKINSRVVLSSERPRGRLFTVGINWCQRREYRSVRDDLDAIERLNLNDVSVVLQKYPLTRATTFVVGPLAEISAPVVRIGEPPVVVRRNGCAVAESAFGKSICCNTVPRHLEGLVQAGYTSHNLNPALKIGRLPAARYKDGNMSSTTGNERRTVHYSGRVQGVGFRYTARSIAQQYKVNGYVQNLDDGRVRLVVEGEAEEINRFLAALAETMARYIRDVTVFTAAASGEFDRFEVRSTTN